MPREADKSDIAFKLCVAATFADISILTHVHRLLGCLLEGRGARERRDTLHQVQVQVPV